ncbi:hypothetical protein [Oscillatoria nigro-viridis]|uniref:hypothetical protein n=1 Tax=Phormidium nigroviride TaxID=482564 RepID=UPI00030B5622|nr:hypothetical protein [Oscillatoria nigro-viridis]
MRDSLFAIGMYQFASTEVIAARLQELLSIPQAQERHPAILHIIKMIISQQKT